MDDSRSTYSVLVVSAAAKFHTSLRELLPEDRYAPLCAASSVAEARRVLLERPFDLVVISTPLPDEFGTKLALHDASPIFTVLAASVYYACRELGKAIDRRHIKWMQNTIAFLAKHSFSVYMSHGVLMQIVVGWREYWPMHVFSVFTSWDTVLKTLC